MKWKKPIEQTQVLESAAGAPSLLYLQQELRMYQAEHMRRLEHQLDMARYRLHPELWLEERFGEDPKAILWSTYPEYANHEWDGDIDPLFQAWKAITGPNWAAVKSGTSTGKTYILSRIVYWFLDCFENSLVVTSAPVEKQLKMHLWSEISVSFHKFKAIRPFSELTYLRLRVDNRRKDDDNNFKDSWQAVGFVAGVKANEESTTKAQGFHRKDMLIITEETPGMPEPTLRAFKNTSTAGNNKILAVGNPDSVTDTLSKFAEGSNVLEFRASAYDHPNVVLGREIIPGAVTSRSIDIRREENGEESQMFKSRVRGISPMQAETSLIFHEWILSCWLYDKDYLMRGEIDLDLKSSNAVGVDVANSVNGDAGCTAFGENNILRQIKEFQCPNATHLAYNLLFDDLELIVKGYEVYHIPKLKQYNIQAHNIGIDAIGVGVATVNAFWDQRPPIRAIALQGGQLDEAIPLDEQEKPIYQFANLRSQMYFQARQDLQHRRIAIDIKDKNLFRKVAHELVLPTYTTKGGRILVEPKENIKKRLGKSPNYADAFVYWNWMRRNYYRTALMPLPFSAGK